jgi:hypothetical protein
MDFIHVVSWFLFLFLLSAGVSARCQAGRGGAASLVRHPRLLSAPCRLRWVFEGQKANQKQSAVAKKEPTGIRPRSAFY